MSRGDDLPGEGDSASGSPTALATRRRRCQQRRRERGRRRERRRHSRRPTRLTNDLRDTHTSRESSDRGHLAREGNPHEGARTPSFIFFSPSFPPLLLSSSFLSSFSTASPPLTRLSRRAALPIRRPAGGIAADLAFLRWVPRSRRAPSWSCWTDRRDEDRRARVVSLPASCSRRTADHGGGDGDGDDDHDGGRRPRTETRDNTTHDTATRGAHGHRRVHATLPRRVATLTSIADEMRAITTIVAPTARSSATVSRHCSFYPSSLFSSSRVFISTAEVSANRRAPSCFLAVASGTDRNGATAGRTGTDRRTDGRGGTAGGWRAATRCRGPCAASRGGGRRRCCRAR